VFIAEPGLRQSGWNPTGKLLVSLKYPSSPSASVLALRATTRQDDAVIRFNLEATLRRSMQIALTHSSTVKPVIFWGRIDGREFYIVVKGRATHNSSFIMEILFRPCLLLAKRPIFSILKAKLSGFLLA
jgi:hypothetical protein